MVRISWEKPEQMIEKEQKYKRSKPIEPVLKFDTFNFKLAVIEVLMYEKELLTPKLDVYEFVKQYKLRKIDIDNEDMNQFQRLESGWRNYLLPHNWRII